MTGMIDQTEHVDGVSIPEITQQHVAAEIEKQRRLRNIRAAIAAIEDGKPDAEINRLCALAFGWVYRPGGECWGRWKDKKTQRVKWRPRPYTTSFDAIKDEMPEGWDLAELIGSKVSGYYAVISDSNFKRFYSTIVPMYPMNRAILFALLRAMESQNAGS